MGGSAETTQREDDPVRTTVRPKLWLSWAHPIASEGIEVEHGLVLGRDESCNVNVEGVGVSRRHVEFCRQGPLFALKDLGSTNGTHLNGKRVEHAAIAPGDVLRIGDHIGVFDESIARPRGFRQIAEGLLGGDALQASLSAATRAATSDLSLVLIGATGTGKERVARGIHELSGRKGPLHAINCAALPPHLAEAELFGHRRGAFTGAERPGLGHFRAADQGTLFLDEIAELPLSLQAKLLRVLEERTVRPLGDTDSVPVDVRVIAATQRPLCEAVDRGQFRSDLLARLAGLTVDLPPLCERRADVAPLFLVFLRHYSGGRPPKTDPRLIEALTLLDWPGNVRELEQLARRTLAVNGTEPVLTREVLPSALLARLPTNPAVASAPLVPAVDRRTHDLQRLAHALTETGGRVAAAATLVGFSRQRAYRLLEGYSTSAFVTLHSTPPPARDRGNDA